MARTVAAAGLAEFLPPLDDATAGDATAVFAEIRAFHAGLVPAPFGALARDPAYLADVWAAWRRAFSDQRLTRRLKTALAFAVSLTTRSSFGTRFHLAELRRLGVGERGVMEVIGGTQMFSITPGSPTPRQIGEHTSELQSQSNLVCRLLL